MNSENAIIHERITVDLSEKQDDVVLFLIGMRINSWWKLWRWIPVAMAMRRMLRELSQNPESGLLATRGGGPGVMVQYWSSFEALANYASDRSGQHYPAWAAFNRALAKSGDVGIWHETFLVPASNIEAVYNHTPPTGLASYLPRVPATGHKKTARQRMKQQEDEQRKQAA
jgi:hypothetical protein